MPLKSVLDACQQFGDSEVCQHNPRVLNNLRTALRRYILPSYGLSPEQLKRHRLDEQLSKLPLSDFLGNAARLLEPLSQTTTEPVSELTLANYRSAVTRFLEWLYSQSQHDTMISHEVGECAPQIYSGQTLTKLRQSRQQTAAAPYALKEGELSATLQQEFQELEVFWVSPSVPNRYEHAIQPSTFRLYKSNILCFLGWLQLTGTTRLEQLQLAAITEPLLLNQFITWAQHERGNSDGWAMNVTKAAIAVTKWLAPSLSEAEQHLTKLQNDLLTLAHKCDLNSETSKPSELLSYDECIQVVEYLKTCCAPRQKTGLPRSELAIVKAWQRYLIVALLTYTPLRQSEIRVLRRGKSLVRDADGYRIVLGTAGKAYQEFALPNHLIEDFDIWFSQFWSKLKIPDNRVFARPGANNRPECLGGTLSTRDISNLVASAIYKATSILFEKPKRPTSATFRNATLASLQHLGHTRPSDSVINTKGQIPHMVRPELSTLTKGQIPDQEQIQPQGTSLENILKQWQSANTADEYVE